MELKNLNLVELLANWRKRLQEAAQKGENLDDLLLQAEKDLEAAGFQYAIPLLRREVMRLKLMGPVLGVEPPRTPNPPSKPIESVKPIEVIPPRPPETGPVPQPFRTAPWMPTTQGPGPSTAKAPRETE